MVRKVVVKLGELPLGVKREIIDFLKSTNPPFKITDDLEITAVEEINGCTATNVRFYRIEVNGLKYGCDYYEDSWNSFDVLEYNWSTKPVKSIEGDIDNLVYCANIAKIFYLVSTTTPTLDEIASHFKYIIDDFLKKNLSKWVSGMDFYDVGDEKWKKVTGGSIINALDYDIKNNKIIIDLTTVDGNFLSGSEEIILWSPLENENRVTKTVKANFDFYGKKIPVEVEIIGGEGLSLKKKK